MGMLRQIGMPELLVILGIVFFIFGAKRLPEFGKSIGETIKAFKGVKKELTEASAEVKQELREVERSIKA